MVRKLVLSSALLMLAACQTPTRTVSAVSSQAPFCKVAEPILYAVADTAETKKQVREHNAVGVELCKW